ncbi:N-acetylglucosamine kinase [Lentibacillus sp.]|uniref:N-acetylglucosamine kinase n=1 Tax=Lentibacillus sp. TaxID=1925746 RepID=UPI002B4B75B3|nr:BadF/BadG/BcrA/BcrD ATPase family protein [Lentibacillus sp.]HLS10172.1 BadF/BadG/BcrA/BcrD ATPase family protein [Lentibacillus sp.]
MINKESFFRSAAEMNNNDFLREGFGSSEIESVSEKSTTNGLLHNQKEKTLHSTIQGVGRTNFPLLAIDGGGTKTIAVITDADGNVLSSGKSGTSNYQVAGFKATIKTLKHVIKKAIGQLNETIFHHDTEINFNVGVFALAGIDTQKDEANVQEIVKQVIEESGVQINRVIVENDALSVLLGETNHSPGVILISGTGSIAFAHDGMGHYARAGGWGHRLGDEGGGYWIGKEAIRAILKMLDGRGPETVLSNLVLNHFQFEKYEQLYNWVYGPNYTIHDVGKLSTIVEEANQLGDPVSKSILDRAVSELYCLVSAVVKRANISDEPFKLLFLGGVLQNSEYVKRELIYKVKDDMTDVDIITNHDNPIDLIVQRGLNG